MFLYWFLLVLHSNLGSEDQQIKDEKNKDRLSIENRTSSIIPAADDPAAK